MDGRAPSNRAVRTRATRLSSCPASGRTSGNSGHGGGHGPLAAAAAANFPGGLPGSLPRAPEALLAGAAARVETRDCGSLRASLPGIQRLRDRDDQVSGPLGAGGTEGGRRRFFLEDSAEEWTRNRRTQLEDEGAEEENEGEEDDSDGTRASSASAAPAAATSASALEPRLPPTPPRDVLDTFAPYNWLSDASISFAYAWLEASGSGVFRDLARSRRLPKSTLLMDPAMAFWLSLQADPATVREAVDSLKLQELDLVCCPINDSSQGEFADTGTHWTLLVCWRPKRGNEGRGANGYFSYFFYYDSLDLRGLDEDSLRNARAIASHLAGRPVQLAAGPCAQQANFCDCGVYVLMFSEIITGLALDAAGSPPGAPPPWESRIAAVTRDEAASYRAHYRALAAGGHSD